MKEGKEKERQDIENGIKDEKYELSIWTKVPEDITKEEESKMIALVFKKGVEMVTGNHLFNWDGNIYLQEDGGSIGL